MGKLKDNVRGFGSPSKYIQGPGEIKNLKEYIDMEYSTALGAKYVKKNFQELNKLSKIKELILLLVLVVVKLLIRLRLLLMI